jgi:hypothetical protein
MLAWASIKINPRGAFEMEFCVLVDWIDGSTEDTSELAITAENERDAILFGIAEWHQEAKQWPNCRITRVWVEGPSEPELLAFPKKLKVFPQGDSPSKSGAKKWGAGKHKE